MSLPTQQDGSTLGRSGLIQWIIALLTALGLLAAAFIFRFSLPAAVAAIALAMFILLLTFLLGARNRTQVVVGLGLSLAYTSALFTLTLPLISPQGLIYSLRTFIIAVAGFLPLILYLSFARGRLQTVFNEYRQNLRRLGFPENAPLYKDKFVEVYSRLPRDDEQPSQSELEEAQARMAIVESPEAELDESLGARRYSPLAELSIVIATALSIFGWIIVFYPADKAPGLGLLPVNEPLIYSFLGAYIFGLSSLVRQFVADDIQPRYYANLTIRYLTVMALSWLAPIIAPEGSSAAWILLLAFFAGLFPMEILRILRRKVFEAFSAQDDSGLSEKLPLTRLDGIKVFEEDRLSLEGINFVQNMASANLVDLMLRTRYPVEQLVDWVDQALLALYARDRLGWFYASGIRSASSLLEMYPVDEPDGRAAVGSPSAAERDDRRQKLTLLMLANKPESASLDTSQMQALLETITVALQHAPNMYHVQYWRMHEFEALPEDVERERLRADLFMIQDMPWRAAELYTRVLQIYPESRNTLLYRGLAYAQQGRFKQAVDDYRQAINRRGRWENIETAYLSLGRAYEKMEDVIGAQEAYRQAFEQDPTFYEALRSLAYLEMTHLGEYESAIAHWTTLIDADYQTADALANRGLTRYTMWQQDKTQASLLDLAEADLDKALNLDRQLIPAYINLALIQVEKKQRDAAIETYRKALLQIEYQKTALAAGDAPAGDQPVDRVLLDRSAYLAHLRRGNLFKENGDFTEAMHEYQQATRLLPMDVGALYNLALMQTRLGQTQEAMFSLREVIRLVEGHAPAHQLLGDLLAAGRQPEAAKQEYSKALTLARRQRDRQGEALAHFSLGKLYRLEGKQDEAAQRELELARSMADEVDDDVLFTQTLYELGLLQFVKKAYPEAKKLLAQAVTLFDVMKMGRESLRANIALAEACLAAKDPACANQAVNQAETQLNAISDPNSPDDENLRTRIQNIKKDAAAFKKKQPSG